MGPQGRMGRGRKGQQALGLAVAAAAALLLAASSAGQRAEGAEMEALVSNGDFSLVAEGKPVGWVTVGDPQYVAQELSAASDGGNPCAKLVCTRAEGGGSLRSAMMAQAGRARLKEGGLYELTCRMRTEGVAELDVRVAVSDPAVRQPSGLRESLRVEETWSQYTVPFAAQRSVSDAVQLQFSFAGTGTLYLDDVRIAAIDASQVVFTHSVPAGKGKNLLPNGSFELGAIGWSAVGRSIAWGNLDRLQGRIEPTGGTRGSRFLRVPLGGAEGPTLYWDYYDPIVSPVRMMLAANLGWVPVQPGRPYTLSCDMRASVAGVAATLGVRNEDPVGSGATGKDLRQKVQLTTEWRRYSFTFTPTGRYVYVTVGPDLDEVVRVDVDVDAIQLEEGGQATAFEPYSPVEVGIEPSQPGGVFTEGEPGSLKLRAYNHGAALAAVRATFSVTDFFDAPAGLPPVALQVPAGGSAEREVPIPADWKGFYRVQATYEGPGLTGGQSLRLAVVPLQTSDDTVVGINHAFPDAFLIQVARKGGVTWYRDWTLKWHDLEPQEGDYHWEVGDRQIDRVLAEGVRLMALMPPYPSAKWNTTGSPDAAGERLPRELAWAPKDPQKLGEFIEKAVAHYKDRVKVWEFLNEPIYTHYALPARGGNYQPSDYVALLKVAYEAMHRADPDCKVIGGIGSLPRKLTKEVIEAGCLDYADVFVLHMYPSGNELTPEYFIAQTDTMLQEMDKHGGRKPTWVTEFSYYGDDEPPTRPYFPGRSWAADRMLDSERQCAEYTVRLFALMMARGTEKFFFHAGVGGRVNMPYYDCAFLKYGGSPAKLFPALAVFAELMGGKARFAGEQRLGERGFCVGFETGKRSVLVLWQPDGQATAAVPEGVECLDIVGRTLPKGPAVLSATPVYLVGPSGEAARLVNSVRLVAQ